MPKFDHRHLFLLELLDNLLQLLFLYLGDSLQIIPAIFGHIQLMLVLLVFCLKFLDLLSQSFYFLLVIVDILVEHLDLKFLIFVQQCISFFLFALVLVLELIVLHLELG
jgi:hypothetical protein